MAATKKARKENETVSADSARARLGELLDRAGIGGERIIIRKHGKDRAVLIGLKDFEKVEAA
jgi:prevent-host-death family protein